MGNCGAKKRAAMAQAKASAQQANRRMGVGAGAASEANLAVAASGASPDLYGSAQTGFGNAIFAQQCPQGIDQDIAMLATSAALAVGIYVVYRHAFYKNIIKKLFSKATALCISHFSKSLKY